MGKPLAKGWTKARRAALRRDNGHCQKCQRHQKEMHVHHIIPRDNGGSDELENLITLCASCHLEWESVMMATTVDFRQWLPLPPAYRLIPMLLTDSIWRKNISAKQARDWILWGNKIIVDLYEQEPNEVEAS